MCEINAAGAAYAPDMTDAATRETWTDDGLRALFARLREMYGDEAVDRASVARIEPDARAGDAPPGVGGTVDCATCEGPSTIADVPVCGKHVRLACGHLTRHGQSPSWRTS